MSKNKAKPTDPLAPALNVGENLLGNFKKELTLIPNPANKKQNIWQMLSEHEQDEILGRFGNTIRQAFHKAFEAILSNGVPAVHSRLVDVAFKPKGIRGVLDISSNSEYRHELSDFADRSVLVILTQDIEKYLASMKSVKADADQTQLPLEDGITEPILKVVGKDEAENYEGHTLVDIRRIASVLAHELGDDDAEDQIHVLDREALIGYIKLANKQKLANEK